MKIGTDGRMPDPSDLLSAARTLCDMSGAGAPTDAHFRRAVSTAYYALFHKIVRSAAERFMGPGQEDTAAFSFLYRAFDHKGMKVTCEALQSSTLSRTYQNHLHRTDVSAEMRDFAGILPNLQAARHKADYDPSVQFFPSDAAALIDSAELAIQAFDRIPPGERTDILALMMVGART
jgi:hypothetical protein